MTLLIRWHILAFRCLWTGVQFTSVLAAMLTSLSHTCANRRIIFYLPVKAASAAESGSEHSLPSCHRHASEFQSARRGQWGEDEGHLPPAMTFVKCWSVQLQPLPKMFLGLFTITLIYVTALLSQVGLWAVQLSRLISRFCLTNLQILSVNLPLSLTMINFICTWRVSTWNSSIAARYFFSRLLYLPQNAEKPQWIFCYKAGSWIKMNSVK